MIPDKVQNVITSYSIHYTKLYDGYRRKFGEKGAATEFAAADAYSADHLGFIANADLAHFNTGVEVVGEVLDQFTEIDPPVGGEIENDLRAVEQVFGADQLSMAPSEPSQTRNNFV